MRNTLMLTVAAVAALNEVSAADTGWKSTAGLNAAINRGNASSTLVGGNILTGRKWDQNELSFGVDGAYGKANGAKNVENFGGFGQYNRLFTDRWYGYLNANARRDTVADLNYRATVSPGVGYYFIKNETTTLRGEVGPGFVLEEFKRQNSRSYFTLRVGEQFTHQFNDHVNIRQWAEFQPKIDDFGDYFLEVGATLSAKIAGNLATTWTVRDLYRSEPAPGRKKNDLQFLAGLSYSF